MMHLLGGHGGRRFSEEVRHGTNALSNSENLPLGRLVADALGEIERLGYSRRSRNRYRATWEHLIAFSRGKELGDEFSADLVARFLEEYRVRDSQVDGPGDGWRRHMVFGVKVLADFAKNGCIERAFTEVQAIHLLPAMQNTLRDYEQYCKDRLHLRPSTLRLRTTELTIFLDFLHSRKARTLDQIQAAGSVRVRVMSRSLAAEDGRADCIGCAFFSPVSHHAWDSAERSQCGAAENPCSQGCNYPVGLGSRTHRQTSRCGRSQFCERETRLRHSLTGMPVGIACWGYSHAETGQPSLGGFDNRNHASEDRARR